MVRCYKASNIREYRENGRPLPMKGIGCFICFSATKEHPNYTGGFRRRRIACIAGEMYWIVLRQSDVIANQPAV